MNRVDMRIQPSGGLVAMVILHAAILSGVAVVIFSAVTAPGPTEECFLPEIEPQDEPTIGRAIELPPVDVAAQQELKQQLFRWRRTTTGRQPCVPCQGSTSRRPSAPADRVVKPLPVDPAEPNEPDTPDALVDPSDADSATKSPLPRSTWQLALFLDDSPLSRRVGKWFESDASLRRLRQQCEFQQYSADNPLYRTRYAERIPVDAFPVVLLQDARGGHIHVASRHNLPATAAALYDDLAAAYQLYRQAQQARITGVLKSEGTSWDAAVAEQPAPLASGDCPDGFCPWDADTQVAPPNRPGQRLRDLLFDRSDPRRALVWADGSEIATIVLAGAAAALLTLIIRKRMYA